MIKIESLQKSFGKHVVLDDINLTFEASHVYGVVGENGAGKTTLFRCLAGLETYQGNISSNLIPIKDHLGLLMTEPFFFTKISGREYIQLLCNARNITSLDIDSGNIFELPLDQYASTYSTGMKKKLALTAVLLQGNQFFIFDEPFNGVDIQSNQIILAIISKLKAMGKTVLISSHLFSTLHEVCDHIIRLKDGKVIENVTKEEFNRIEQDMRIANVGDRVERLDLK